MKNVGHYGLVLVMAFATACSIPAYTKAQPGAASFRSGTEGSFDRTMNVSGTVDLEVSTGSGSIDIKPASGSRVEVHGKIRAGSDWRRSDRDIEDVIRRIEADPPIEQSGQTIRIGRIAGRDLENNVSISYEIAVPTQSNVRAHTGSGGQTVEGISGKVEASTGSGGITLRNIKGDLEANAGSGSIHATGLRGGLRVRTGSGGIQVEGEQTARWELQTGSGGIDIHLPRNAGFELTAHTGSGGVYLDYPMTVQGKIDRNRHDVSGKVGNGAYQLNARTGSGHIRID